jgi:hypothetical protein
MRFWAQHGILVEKQGRAEVSLLSLVRDVTLADLSARKSSETHRRSGWT